MIPRKQPGKSLLVSALALACMLCIPCGAQAAAAVDSPTTAPRVLLVSSILDGADVLAAAARDDVLVVKYKTRRATLDSLVRRVEKVLNGRQCASIAIAAHDFGSAKFYLTGSETISLASTVSSPSQQDFWWRMGAFLEEGGRIDLLSCGLASNDQGAILVAALEECSGVNFAASNDKTGNPATGGNWVLETDGIDVADLYFDPLCLPLYQASLSTSVHKVAGEDAGGTYDGKASDRFGFDVAISGDYAVVGAPMVDDNTVAEGETLDQDWGQAYVFERDQGGSDNWGFVKSLRPVGPSGKELRYDDEFGRSVGIDGTVIVVGCARWWGNDGAVFIYYKDEGGVDNWGLKAEKYNPATGDEELGWDVAISGNYIVAGAKYDDYTNKYGGAYIYEKDHGGADTWGTRATLTASSQSWNDAFGTSVDIDGTTAVCGVPSRGVVEGESPNNGSGAAYVYEKDSGGADTWGEVTVLAPGDLVAGDLFGSVVAIDGDQIVVGVPKQNSWTGSVYVFGRNTGGAENWGQDYKKTATDAESQDQFGTSVAIDGTRAFVGAPGWDITGTNAEGAVYGFDTSTWTQMETRTAVDAATYNYFGTSADIQGTDAIFGATGATVSAESSTGAAYIYNATVLPVELGLFAVE